MIWPVALGVVRLLLDDEVAVGVADAKAVAESLAVGKRVGLDSEDLLDLV